MKCPRCGYCSPPRKPKQKFDFPCRVVPLDETLLPKCDQCSRPFTPGEKVVAPREPFPTAFCLDCYSKVHGKFNEKYEYGKFVLVTFVGGATSN